MNLKREAIPLAEEQFQALLAAGLITQCPSDHEEICIMLGLTYHPDPNEIPLFDLDKSIISDLLVQAKFDPVYSETITFCRNLMYFANQYSQEIHVSQSGMYIKVLHNTLITEIGFQFESNNLNTLKNSLSSASVERVEIYKTMVKVPFFITQWNDKYIFSNLDMENFKKWLTRHFSHKNIPYEISAMLKEYSEELNRGGFLKKMINYDLVYQAVNPIEQQLVSNVNLVSNIEKIPTATLSLANNIEAKPAEVEIPKDFFCPLTLEVMISPVLCTLDGRSYEEAEIRQWLSTKRTSPLTRTVMIPGASIDSVLCKNINLRNAIETFKTTNPALFQEVENAFRM